MPRHRVLVVDDDSSVAAAVRYLLEEEGHDVVIAAGLDEARKRLGERFDLVVTDLQLPDGSGLSVLEEAKKTEPDVPVLMITAFATIDTAVKAMKLGAFDYLTKPFDNDRLKSLCANALRLRELALENVRLRDEVGLRLGLGAIVGQSPQMAKVRDLVRLAAASDAAVMITGETGTGKELVARAIHYSGSRAGQPFVAVNCGAIPEGLVESELFGHKKGAFTGAVGDRDGRFVQADGGTIFLDEVTEMRKDAQVKLLRAIESREVQPVGSTDTLKVDVRILSATNRDPKECVEKQEFRHDLYYRLNVFALPLPSLRQHKSDIPEIVADFLGRRGLPAGTVGQAALELLTEHDFPGNVRELQNVIEFGLILSQGRTVEPEHVADRLLLRPEWPQVPNPHVRILSKEERMVTLAAMERSHLEAALEKTGGNQSQAARLLGISRATLLYRMKRHGLG